MKHASAQALDGIEALLADIRRFDALRERKRGVFYLKSRAFLHFHEDEGIVYADVRASGDDFERLRLSTPAERARLVAVIGDALARPPA